MTAPACGPSVGRVPADDDGAVHVTTHVTTCVTTRVGRILLGLAYAPGGLAVGLYVLHAVTLFVLSMGVPVPQLALGAVAGAVAGRAGLDVARVRRLTVTTLAVLGTLGAVLAMSRPSTAYDLRHSLGLPFEVTPPMVLALVVVGGPLLLAGQWVCTTAGARLAARRPDPSGSAVRRATPPAVRQPAARA